MRKLFLLIICVFVISAVLFSVKVWTLPAAESEVLVAQPAGTNPLPGRSNPHGSKSLGELNGQQQNELAALRREVDTALLNYLRKEAELGLLNKSVSEMVLKNIWELLDFSSKPPESEINGTRYSL